MVEIFENHCLEACFKPYKDLFSLQTLELSCLQPEGNSFPLQSKPGGRVM
jgi:hypothetical protein